MAIKFYSTHGAYGSFSNFSRHSIFLDNHSWPTVEHYFQAQKHIGTPRYKAILKASTPKIAATLGRERDKPLRADWEIVKDDIMRKAVKRKFQSHADIRKILLSTGIEEIIEDSPKDSYWGIGPDDNGKNILGKILMETREYLKEFKHCLTCGITHRIKESCPPEAFRILTCSCGNETLIPCDALFMGTKGMHCGQCEKDTDWKARIPTIEDMKKHWKDYVPPGGDK